MKLKDIASRIDSHLKRFEHTPSLNPLDRKYGTRPYFWANSYAAGRFVYVTYISYQGTDHLTKDEATRYLAWLDAGNVGRHIEALARPARLAGH